MGNQSKYAVISDVHANAEALRSALRELKKRQIHDIYFLGDAVGYGPDPDESIEVLKSECKITLAGNHDWGAAGLTDTESFNENAKIALAWTRGVLTAENNEILKTSPLKTEIKKMDITLVHATPYEPEHWHYLLNLSDALKNFAHMRTDICFVGHTHKPYIIEKPLSGELRMDKIKIQRKEGSRYIVNTWSIGQPRDRDPRACYAVVDDDSIELVRTKYDIQATQKKMEDVGLPLPLIERLAYGL